MSVQLDCGKQNVSLPYFLLVPLLSSEGEVADELVHNTIEVCGTDHIDLLARRYRQKITGNTIYKV